MSSDEPTRAITLPDIVEQRAGEGLDAEGLAIAPRDEPVAAHHRSAGDRLQILMVRGELVVGCEHVEDRPTQDLGFGPAVELLGGSVPEQDPAVRIGDDDGPGERVQDRPDIGSGGRCIVRVVRHAPPRMTETYCVRAR